MKPVIEYMKTYGWGTDFRTVYSEKTKQYFIYDARHERKRYFDVSDFNDFMGAVEEVMWHRGHEESQSEFGGAK